MAGFALSMQRHDGTECDARPNRRRHAEKTSIHSHETLPLRGERRQPRLIWRYSHFARLIPQAPLSIHGAAGKTRRDAAFQAIIVYGDLPPSE